MHPVHLCGRTVSRRCGRIPRATISQIVFEIKMTDVLAPPKHFCLRIIRGNVLFFLSEHAGGWWKIFWCDIYQILSSR